MRKFVITSSKFEGSITLVYNEHGRVIKMDIETLLTDHQHAFFMSVFPAKITQLDSLKARQSVKIIEVLQEVSFDEFYDAFGNKVGRIKAENVWKRMSRAEQLKAFKNIPKYKNYLNLNQGIAQLYPATYLNQKRWND